MSKLCYDITNDRKGRKKLPEIIKLEIARQKMPTMIRKC